MIRKIMKDPLFLQEKSSEASKDDLWIGKDLQDTLEEHREQCLGMAANMIGYKKRVIIVSLGFVDLVMFNPQIMEKSREFESEESCLSLVGAKRAKRYKEIRVEYLDLNWRKKSLRLKDLPAQICQHELDHLEGILI
ncbi:peptide deformylase [Streptococcus catagoni]|uniref:peptide deformylase n=1 Tax=Streptococcus catagoni TaxID=2654874 RepID=UPI00140CB7A4|nr:peptide deformylase [Streptococcus catagoni]